VNFWQGNGREEGRLFVSEIFHFRNSVQERLAGTGGHRIHLTLPWLLTANTGTCERPPKL
jgi:hypothetical protein